jgi:hypothetical protein
MDVPPPSRKKDSLVPAKVTQWSLEGSSVDKIVLARLGDLGRCLGSPQI